MLLADQNRCRPSSRWWPLRRPIFEPASKRKRMAEKLLCFFECIFVDVSEEFSIRFLKTTKYFFILCLTASKESFVMSGRSARTTSVIDTPFLADLSRTYKIAGVTMRWKSGLCISFWSSASIRLEMKRVSGLSVSIVLQAALPTPLSAKEQKKL